MALLSLLAITPAEAGAQIIADGLVDFIAHERKFLPNPDLPFRFEDNLPLNKISDMDTLFGGNERGYTDYPTYQNPKEREAKNESCSYQKIPSN